jgi:hypothetical protein
MAIAGEFLVFADQQHEIADLGRAGPVKRGHFVFHAVGDRGRAGSGGVAGQRNSERPRQLG